MQGSRQDGAAGHVALGPMTRGPRVVNKSVDAPDLMNHSAVRALEMAAEFCIIK